MVMLTFSISLMSGGAVYIKKTLGSNYQGITSTNSHKYKEI